jgi:hypothetical protein
MMKTRQRLRVKDRTVVLMAAVLMLAGLTVTGTVNAQPAEAAGLYGPDTCLYGYVWREATTSGREDRVCVSFDSRDRVAEENSLGPGRKEAGSDWCVEGFVWREANAEDKVCVTPESRDLVQWENDTAWQRRALDTYASHLFAGHETNTGGGGGVAQTVDLELGHSGTYTFWGTIINSNKFATDYTLVCVVPTLDDHLLAISQKVTVRGQAAGWFGGDTSKDFRIADSTAEVENHWAAIDPNRDMMCKLGGSTSASSIAKDLQKAEKAISGIAKVIAWF